MYKPSWQITSWVSLLAALASWQCNYQQQQEQQQAVGQREREK